MKQIILDDLSNYRERLELSNNYGFLKVNNEKVNQEIIIDPIIELINSESILIEEISINQKNHFILYKKLNWESDYFSFPCYLIDLILFNHDNYLTLRDVLNTFISGHLPQNSFCKINVSAEDILLIQAISSTKFNLIETRLNYVIKIDPEVKSLLNKKIQKSNVSDAPYFKSIAKKMRNKFDWIHADPTFSNEIADEYLGRFGAQTLQGLADLVLKCVDEDDKPFGFLATNYPQNICGNNVSKLVLAAIDNSKQKGLLFTLLNEIIYELKEKNAHFLTTITQAANMPAIKTWEKAGFNLYKITHLYTLKND